jgi:dTDP-glucose 4,6-dehydratase
MNLYGERQHPEKFVPKIIKKVLSGELLEIHGTPDRTQSGSRFYIHCRNMADAILFLLNNVKSDGVIRDKFNIVGEKEVSNLTLAQTIADYLGKPLNYEIVDFHSSRPGHDLRYALNGTKLASLGWRPPLSFEESLLKTVKWVVAPENAKWLNL